MKLGGRLEGTLRQSFRKNGVAAGPGPLRILAPEWRASRRVAAGASEPRRAQKADASMADLVFFYGTLMTGFDRRRRIGIDPRMTVPRPRMGAGGAVRSRHLSGGRARRERPRVGRSVRAARRPRASCTALDEIEGYRPGEPDSSLYIRSLSRCTFPTARPSRRGSTSTTPRSARRRASIPGITWSI